MRTAYFTYKKYAENYVCSSDYKITAKQTYQYLQALCKAAFSDLDELIRDAIKSGEFQVTFECKNSNITHEVIAELKKNGYMIEISDHNENYITIYWRQSICQMNS